MLELRRLIVAAITIGLILTGCSSNDGEEVARADSDTSSTARDDTTDTTPDQVEKSGSVQGTLTVDEEIVHPGGTSVTVNEITVEDNAVYLDIEAFNGSGRDVTLANSPFTTHLYTQDGRELPFRAPEENPRLTVADGGELEATLAFVGRLAPSDAPLTFELNWRPSGPEDENVPNPPLYPSFQFDGLPLPGASK